MKSSKFYLAKTWVYAGILPLMMLAILMQAIGDIGDLFESKLWEWRAKAFDFENSEVQGN